MIGHRARGPWTGRQSITGRLQNREHNLRIPAHCFPPFLFSPRAPCRAPYHRIDIDLGYQHATFSVNLSTEPAV